jgi:uncharacterized membrane protein YkoI
MMMKRKLVIGVLAASVVLGGAFAVGASNGADDTQFDDRGGLTASQSTAGTEVEVETEHGQTLTKVKLDDSQSVPADVSANSITAEKAKEIATAKYNGTVTKVEQEMEHGRLEYKIEIQTSNGEVDVRIDATTGEITRVDQVSKNDDNGGARIGSDDVNDDHGGDRIGSDDVNYGHGGDRIGSDDVKDDHGGDRKGSDN